MPQLAPLLPDDLHERPLSPSAVKFSVKDLLPGSEVELALRNGDDDFTTHDLPFQVRVRVVFPGAVVMIVRGWLMGREFLQPNLVIVQKAALVVVDENRGGDVHGIDQAETFLDSALANEFFNGIRDIYKAPAIGHLEPKVFSKSLHRPLVPEGPALSNTLFYSPCWPRLAAGFVGQAAAANKKAELTADVNEAKAALLEKDEGLKDVFDKASGYVIFPSVAKGGLGVGAARGTGQLLEKGKLMGQATLTQVSIGFQAGGQAYVEVIFFEDQTSLDNFKKGNFEFSAQVSAVAVTAGVSKNAKYEKGVMVMTLAKGGLMYEASGGGGQKFKYKAY